MTTVTRQKQLNDALEKLWRNRQKHITKNKDKQTNKTGECYSETWQRNVGRLTFEKEKQNMAVKQEHVQKCRNLEKTITLT